MGEVEYDGGRCCGTSSMGFCGRRLWRGITVQAGMNGEKMAKVEIYYGGDNAGGPAGYECRSCRCLGPC